MASGNLINLQKELLITERHFKQTEAASLSLFPSYSHLTVHWNKSNDVSDCSSPGRRYYVRAKELRTCEVSILIPIYLQLILPARLR
jgi:hypothetical protein